MNAPQSTLQTHGTLEGTAYLDFFCLAIRSLLMRKCKRSALRTMEPAAGIEPPTCFTKNVAGSKPLYSLQTEVSDYHVDRPMRTVSFDMNAAALIELAIASATATQSIADTPQRTILR